MHDPTGQNGDEEPLAAELALRLDNDRERKRYDGEANEALAADIAQWEIRFAALAALASDVPPPDDLWARIEAAIMADDEPASPAYAPRRGWLAGAALAAAAACLLLFFNGPETRPQTGVAVATIAGADTRVLARYEPRSGRMRVDVQAFGEGGGVPELWLIVAGRDPVSLGQLPSRGPAEMDMPRHLRPLIAAGAELAITREAPSAEPHRLPSGAPIAEGRIIIA